MLHISIESQNTTLLCKKILLLPITPSYLKLHELGMKHRPARRRNVIRFRPGLYGTKLEFFYRVLKKFILYGGKNSSFAPNSSFKLDHFAKSRCEVVDFETRVFLFFEPNFLNNKKNAKKRRQLFNKFPYKTNPKSRLLPKTRHKTRL